MMTQLSGKSDIPDSSSCAALNMREQLVREVEIIPVEVVVRNVAAGSSVATRLDIKPREPRLPRPLIEWNTATRTTNSMIRWSLDEHITRVWLG